MLLRCAACIYTVFDIHSIWLFAPCRSFPLPMYLYMYMYMYLYRVCWSFSQLNSKISVLRDLTHSC
jgi:hypothetical protein